MSPLHVQRSHLSTPTCCSTPTYKNPTDYFMSVIKDDSVSVRLAEAFRLEQQSRPRRLMQLQYSNSLTRSAAAAVPAGAGDEAPGRTGTGAGTRFAAAIVPAGAGEAGTARASAGVRAGAGMTTAPPAGPSGVDAAVSGDHAAHLEDSELQQTAGSLISAPEGVHRQDRCDNSDDAAVDGAASVSIAIRDSSGSHLEISGPSSSSCGVETAVQGVGRRRGDSDADGASVAIVVEPLETCGPSSDSLRRAEAGVDASSSGQAAGAPVWYQVRIMMTAWLHCRMTM